MAQIIISEYMGTKRKSRVLKDEKTAVYIVECVIDQVITRRELFNTINRAEDFAEDWIQCH